MTTTQPFELNESPDYDDAAPTRPLMHQQQRQLLPRWLPVKTRRRTRVCLEMLVPVCRPLLTALLILIIVLLILLIAYSTPPSFRLALARSHPDTNIILPYTAYPAKSKNKSNSTIVLLHGACSDAGEWDLVIQTLSSDYHLLVPDLPHHARARNITPFNFPDTSNLVANLIRSYAHSGFAHVVGLSLGAHVAVIFTAKHPQLAASVVASGWRDWGRPWYTPLIPPVLVFQNAV